MDCTSDDKLPLLLRGPAETFGIRNDSAETFEIRNDSAETYRNAFVGRAVVPLRFVVALLSPQTVVFPLGLRVGADR